MINRSYYVDPGMIHGHEYVTGDRWLNVGCGLRNYEGFWNTDRHAGEKVDEIVDLMDIPLPFKDDDWDFIVASHVLEHIPHYVPGQDVVGDYLVHLVNEFIRILKPGGILEIHTPLGPPAMFVVDHCRFVDQITFRGWQPGYITTSLFADICQLSQPKIRLIRKYIKREFKIGKINIWHTRHYLGLEVGKVTQHILIYKVLK